jgi:hypothetical protein
MPIDNTLLEELKAIADEENGSPIPAKKMNRLIIAGELAIIKQLNEFEITIKGLEKNSPEKFLVRNWRMILTLGVAAFLLLHSLIPADMSLWSWFGKFFGGG